MGVTAPKVGIGGLQSIAISEHEKVCLAASDMVTHAIACGRVLRRLKDMMPRGSWGKWLEASSIGRSAGQWYMRFALYEEIVGAAPNMKAAKVLVRGLPRSAVTPRADWWEHAAELRDGGLTYAQIAPMVGKTAMAVYKALNPEAYVAEQERRRMATRQRRLAEQAIAVMQRERAERKGGPLGLALKSFRELLRALDDLATDGDTTRVRQESGKAMRDIQAIESRIASLLPNDG